MKRTVSASFLMSLFLAAACVTINVYFPAAAAEKAADRIIDDVWKAPAKSGDAAPKPVSSLPARFAIALLDAVIPVAEAQQPNIDVSSPEVQRIKASMEARHSSLKPFFESGAIGLTGDGMVSVRDASVVSLAQRNTVKSLVAEENSDRSALYHQIAVANGQPQWAGQIQSVFAQRWVAKAQKGWWYQDSDGWKQK